MSKKYILEVKEEYSGITYFPEPIDNHQIVNFRTVKYSTTVLGTVIHSDGSLLTQEEINELPYGFVQMFNIVEVEDTKYYWRLKSKHMVSFEDYMGLIYLNKYYSGDLELNDKYGSEYSKTKFTEAEARELLGDDFEMFERVDIA